MTGAPSLRGGTKSGILATLRQERPLIILMGLVTFIYSLLSMIRHWRFQTGGVDLGVFDQIVWEYSRFQIPSSSLLGLSNALGDHFNPILALIAPLYWVFPGPEILFVLQSFAVAFSAVAVFRFAGRRLERRAAYGWTLAYAVFWGIQAAMGCDFHPDLLALPMIAFGLDYLDQEDWTRAFLCLGLLLTVKEDFTLLIVFFGIFLLVRRQWGRGLFLVGSGLVLFYLLVLVLVPYLAGSQDYPHWVYTELGKTSSESVRAVLRDPFLVLKVAFNNPEKMATVACGLAACGFMILFSPVFILLLPLYAERLLSGFEHQYSMGYHYSAALAPLLFMGGVDGLFRLSRFLGDPVKRRKTVLGVSAVILVLNLATIPIFSLRDLTRWKFYCFSPGERMGNQVLALIPPDASVIAQNTIAAHLAHRLNIELIGQATCEKDCDYFVACDGLSTWPLPDFESIQACVKERLDRGYFKVFEGGGWILLKR